VEDASGFRGRADRILTPGSAAEVAAILAEAARLRVPLTIAGALTGVTGGGIPGGGWAISTARMTRLQIQAGRAIAAPGVLLKDLHAAAARSRQLYAPDPTEDTASVGGTIATNASGSRSFLYGPTRRHVLSLEVAFMDGSLRRFRRGDAIDFDVPAIPLPATTKNTAGYPLAPGMDWIDLVSGSEGTLGVVTEAELQLLPAPGELLTGVAFLPSESQPVAAVDQWRLVPGLRMLEYFDAGSLELLRRRFPEIPAGAMAAILFEQESPCREEIDDWVERLDKAGADTHNSWFASSDGDRERLRRFRHALPEMVNDTVRRNGFMKLGTDFAVPVARNAEMLARYQDLLGQEFADRYVVFGHIGDAHLHANILPRSQSEFDRGCQVVLQLARDTVALGGTVSAEHGLGKRKAALLQIQYAKEHIQAMRDVKRRLDPKWLLGRGNLFPDPD
jgi:FAD/FMN-containing dehydrogenase